MFERGIAALWSLLSLLPCSSIASEDEGKPDADEESVEDEESEGLVGSGVEAPEERDMRDGER